MTLTTRPLDRRTFLRASGVALGLPLLESMAPALARAAAADGPRRLVTICSTLGLYSSSWFPKAAGAGYEATEYLRLIDGHRARYTLFSGLSHEEQTGRQPHNSEITWLTAARRPGLDGFRNTVSLDQVAANHLGYVTRFPSVVLGTAGPQSQSFTTSGAMVPAETSPAALFGKLFLQGTPAELEREARSLEDGGSILDRLESQTAALRRRVGAADRRKLDAYFDAVRAAERELTEAQTGRQPHNSEITWLTAARRPGLDGFRNTVSLDQVAANHLGYVTRFPSVVLGTAGPQSQSFTTSGAMVPAETSPAALFGKLFLQGTPAELEREARSLEDGGSILDRLESQTAALRRRVGAADRRKLDAYFDAVRAAERELTEAQAWLDRPKPAVDEEPPADLPDPADLIGRIRLMFRMIPLILETDSSRVISLMIHDHGVVPRVRGVTGDQHSLSHHGQDGTKIAQLKKIETEIVRAFGDLLTDLAGRGDAGGSLLERTMVLFGSNLGNANAHTPVDLPILLAGGGFAHGTHVVHEGGHNAPLCNLFVTMLRSMGVEADSFGQSTGALTWS